MSIQEFDWILFASGLGLGGAFTWAILEWRHAERRVQEQLRASRAVVQVFRKFSAAAAEKPGVH